VELVEVADTVLGPTALTVTSPIEIRGNANGIMISRSVAGPEMRVFRVAAGGSLGLDSIMISGGIAVGADGALPRDCLEHAVFQPGARR
jgi:hypothetical protein